MCPFFLFPKSVELSRLETLILPCPVLLLFDINWWLLVNMMFTLSFVLFKSMAGRAARSSNLLYWNEVKRASFIPSKIEKVPLFKVKSRVKTWQVRGIWSQQLQHKKHTEVRSKCPIIDAVAFCWRSGSNLHPASSCPFASCWQGVRIPRFRTTNVPLTCAEQL